MQNFTSLAGPAADELRRLGFAGVPIMPTAVVDVSFGSFDEYLSGMRAPYRRRARQTMKRSAELRIEHVDEFAALAGLANGPMRPHLVEPRRAFKDPPPSAEELVARRALPG